MFRLSSRTHGFLDLMTAGTLVTLPRVLGWGERLTDTLTAVGVGALGYSLLTDYEFGLIRLLPMRAHLALDAMSGAALCAGPWMFPEEDEETRAALVGLGLFELAAALMTQPESGTEQARDMTRSLAQHQWPTATGYSGDVRRSSTASML